MEHRKEIDGLRAVAVLPVILFHAGSRLFTGGFLGVDIFFVISGYLITSIIAADCERGCFSLAHFYERRVRRILPALLVVTLVCLPLAWLWMPPRQLRDFSASAVAVSVFASNFLFWWQTDYFATAAEEKPLMHTWSLAVEEQYYVFFPLLVLVLWRLGRPRLAAVIGALALGSIFLAQAGGNLALDSGDVDRRWDWWQQPSWAFFLAPTRAWELFAGALAALLMPRMKKPPSPAVAQAAAATGLALVAGAVLLFDSATPTPSVYTLVPVVGTVLLIVFARPSTAVGYVLSRPGLVLVGLISYSAYLWHQPLFAFARVRSLDEPGPLLLTVLCLGTLALAYLTWRYVERPFRDRQRVGARTVYATALTATLVVIVVGLFGWMQTGAVRRSQLPALVAETIRQSERKAECFDKDDLHVRADWLCALGNRDQTSLSFMVFGDSHAFSMLPAFDRAAGQLGRSGVFVSARLCPPLLGVRLVDSTRHSDDCALLSDRVLRYVADRGIDTLFLVARWTYYTDGGYTGENLVPLSADGLSGRSRATSRVAFAAGLRRTIAAYRELGVTVHVLGQVPQQLYEPTDLYYRLHSQNEHEFAQSLRQYSVPHSSFSRLHAHASGLFRQAEREGGIRFTPLDPVYCDRESCPIGNPRESYFFDDDHLSVVGALKAVAVIRDLVGESRGGTLSSPS